MRLSVHVSNFPVVFTRIAEESESHNTMLGLYFHSTVEHSR